VIRSAALAAAVLTLVSGCRDDCDRAVARLQRIHARKLEASRVSLTTAGSGLNPLLAQSPAERTALMTAACHDAKSSAYDPALACALHARSDEAAAACIDAMLHDVVHEAPPVPTPGPVTHRERCGAVQATWRGEHDPTYDSDRWDTLVIEVDGHAKHWTSDLSDFAPDARTTELFSPDCRHLMLLTSRNGPYHIIRTDRMGAYLDGAKPDFTLAGERTPLPDGDGFVGAGVFRGGGWLSNTKVAYTWGCCDPPVTTELELPH
jgi:hypothetical protein